MQTSEPVIHHNLAFRVIGNILLTVNVDSPTQSEWTDYVALANKVMPVCRAGVAFCFGSGGPNAGQRKQLEEIAKRIPPPKPKGLIVTDDTIVRGIVTALSWMPAMRDVNRACSHAEAVDHLQSFIGLSRLEAIDLAGAAKALHARMPSVERKAS